MPQKKLFDWYRRFGFVSSAACNRLMRRIPKQPGADRIVIRQVGKKCVFDMHLAGKVQTSPEMGRVEAKRKARQVASESCLPLFNVKVGGIEVAC